MRGDVRVARRLQADADRDEFPTEDDVPARVVVILRVLHYVLAETLVVENLQHFLRAGILTVQRSS